MLHMSILSCVQSCICPDYRAFNFAYVQTIVRPKSHMSRLSCVQNCICPVFRAFKIAYVQTIVRSFFSRPCNFESTTPPGALILVWTYRLSGTSTWAVQVISDILIAPCSDLSCLLWKLNIFLASGS